MRARRLEDILEECITACADGRRTVEQSLALYPAHAAELEPLLRTALGFSDKFQAYNPPLAVQQRGLQHFLDAAADKRSVRQFARSFEKSPWWSGLFRKPAFAGMAAAAAVAVITVAVAGGSMLSGSVNDPGPGPVVENPSDAPPPPLASLQAQIDSLRNRGSQGGPLATTDPEFAEIQRLLDQLEANPDSVTQSLDAERTILEAYTVLTTAADANPQLASDPVVQETIESARNIAGAAGFDLPAPTGVAVAQPTPAATDTPVTDAPTQPPAPTPVATPTPPATATPSPTPVPLPSETADSRVPPAFGD